MIAPEELREIRRQVSALADLVGRLQVRLMKLELRESGPANPPRPEPPEARSVESLREENRQRARRDMEQRYG